MEGNIFRKKTRKRDCYIDLKGTKLRQIPYFVALVPYCKSLFIPNWTGPNKAFQTFNR